jgi:hypothetical protein
MCSTESVYWDEIYRGDNSPYVLQNLSTGTSYTGEITHNVFYRVYRGDNSRVLKSPLSHWDKLYRGDNSLGYKTSMVYL